jgi:hypothetical protein
MLYALTCAFVTVAAMQGLLFFGGGVIFVAILYVGYWIDPPLDPEPWWTGILVILANAALGTPAAIGLLAMLSRSFPGRDETIALAAVGMLISGTIWFWYLNGWDAPVID